MLNQPKKYHIPHILEASGVSWFHVEAVRCPSSAARRVYVVRAVTQKALNGLLWNLVKCPEFIHCKSQGSKSYATALEKKMIYFLSVYSWTHL